MNELLLVILSIVIIFSFIVYQMHDRKKDREQWLSDQLTKSFNKGKNDNR